ncbi:MAG: hypothetical protein HZC36_09580 [Armatimonadetes bacterium]|nr:hypothetical protein [Armatimonadota bacterium]
MTEAELAKLSQAMDWVIPPDKTPGAGSAVCVQRMVELIEAETPEVLLAFQRGLPALEESDLADPSHRFAQLLIEMVRDVYYGYPETGSWADIGFKVTDP